MEFESFPAEGRFKTAATGELVEAGGATFPAHQELAGFYVTVYMQGARGAAEQIRAKIFSDSAYTKLLATGEWANLVEANEGATNWLGKILLSFDPPHNIEAGTEYFLAIETDGYTRDGDTSYIAFSYDWPLPINDNVDAPFYALQMDWRSYQRVRY